MNTLHITRCPADEHAEIKVLRHGETDHRLVLLQVPDGKKKEAKKLLREAAIKCRILEIEEWLQRVDRS